MHVPALSRYVLCRDVMVPCDSDATLAEVMRKGGCSAEAARVATKLCSMLETSKTNNCVSAWKMLANKKYGIFDDIDIPVFIATRATDEEK